VTLDEFKIQLKRLKDQFGEKTYSDERAAVLFQSLKQIFLDRFKAAVDYLLLNERQAPMLPQIWNAINSAKQSEEAVRNMLPTREESSCQSCYGGGYMFSKDDHGYEYISRCHCATGKWRPEKLCEGIPLSPIVPFDVRALPC